MDFDQLTILVEKYLDGTINPSEEQVLQEWYRNTPEQDIVWPADRPGERARLETRLLDRLHKDIRMMDPDKHIVPLRRNRVWMAAATIGLLLLSGAVYLWSARSVGHTAVPATAVKAPVNDLLPGGNKARLMLSDGSTIALDSAGDGLLAEQGNTRVKKTAQGQLTYQVAAASGPGGVTSARTTIPAHGDITYNTIFTPQGGTYAVTLSDGTRVWLNTGTSLRYPTAFTGASRTVELKGEAYFEVASDAARPFSVVGGGQTIRVLGTHFNINAYDNEPAIRTTLLQGSVKVVQGDRELLLRPGEQSLSTSAGALRVKKDIDTAAVMAWKNGMFQFDEADIGTVMRQIARWYNVEVVFNGKLPDDHFRGKIPRNVNASEALQILTLSGIQFKIDGHKIILN